MVIENLQIAPLGEWLLGAGWYNGWLWGLPGAILLLVLLAGGGFALLAIARRPGGRPGPAVSTLVGAICGLLSLGVLAVLVMCSTAVTQNILTAHVAGPLFNVLSPMLGKEIDDSKAAQKSELKAEEKSDPAPQGDEAAAKDPVQVKPTAKAKDSAAAAKDAAQSNTSERNWTSGALYTWLGAVIGFFGVVYFCAWLACVLLAGPAQGTQQCGRTVLEIGSDLARLSSRRIFALAWLAWRESIRRRVVAVFVVFVGVILFAAFFMKKDSAHPSQLYITVVLNCTIFLTMLFALVLSSLSLPGDIRDRTLHTVVTKPVRKIEIVAGRVLGFTAVGTLLLAAIGLVSYGFTVNGLRHSHRLTSDMLHKEMLPGNRGYLLVGETSESHGHAHRVTINEKGECTVEKKQDHTHELFVEEKDGQTTYRLGPPIGQLQARVPIYGRLSFTDKTGKLKDQAKNINVGDEWNYRSFIQGRTAAEAKWVFADLHEEMFPADEFPQGIPVEMTIEVFRTHKGNMEKGVPGSIWLSNPETGKKVLLENFAAEKFATDVHMIPLHFSREGRDGTVERYDLFRDLVSKDGRLAISVQCLEYGQNFGMAQPDMYIRAADANFAWNFVKSYVGIWLQMVLVLSVGVMFSTFVSGPVALLATLFAVLVGLCSGYLIELGTGKMIGGGPFEAAERIMTQDNMISEMEPGIKTSTIKALDEATSLGMRYFSAVVPDFTESSFDRHLAYGFNIGRDLITRCIIRELGFVLPVLLIGYLCLKQREVAQ